MNTQKLTARGLLASGVALASILTASSAFAQDEPVNGIRATDLRVHALTDVTIVPRPGEVIESGIVVIRDGRIEAVGPADAVRVPADARVWSLEGHTVYAGLIDPSVMISPGELRDRPGAHWNRHVHPEVNAADYDLPGESVAKSLRKLGFTTAAVYPDAGIFRGTGVILSLGGGDFKPVVYRESGDLAVGFDRGGGYPNSLMGSIAAFRQTLYDAQWHETATEVWNNYPAGNEPPTRSDALNALSDALAGRQSVLFEVTDEHNFLRAVRAMNEFDLKGTILGSGREFRRLGDVIATGAPVILPISFPERPDVSSLAQADSTSLDQLATWEQAPTNMRRLVNAGATVALTTHKLSNRDKFYSNLRRALTNGLTEEQALAALTTTPADMLGLGRVLGTVEAGKVANLVITDGPLFEKDTKIRDTWIDGRRYEITPEEDPSYIGMGLLTATVGNAEPVEAIVRIDTTKNLVRVRLPDGEKARAKKVEFDGHRLSFLMDGRLLGTTGWVQFTGTLTDDTFAGTGALPDRSRFSFAIEPSDEDVAADEDETDDEDDGRSGRGDDAEDTTDETDPDDDGVSGNWDASFISDQLGGEMPFGLTLALDGNAITGNLESEFFNADIQNGTYDAASGALAFSVVGGGLDARITGTVTESKFAGQLTSDTIQAQVSGSRNVGGDDDEDDTEEADIAPEELVLPLGAYGLVEPPQQQNVLLTNATIWTSGPEGIIENGSMIIRDGKIASITSDLSADLLDISQFFDDNGELIPIIDCQGKHISPGLLDCHSHTGISGGVNEGSQAVTAEVRIGDCINPDDINWYRQLAGGLTTVNQLHGSANPIGGQNSVVKLKWGTSAEDMRVTDAIPGIKFALGENVKRSQNRYPNTRMGVETLIRDSFVAARDYQRSWNRYNDLPQEEKARTTPPRRDIELDTLVEILEGKRIIHCHSYRQDEILALIRTAEEFGFTIGTLQHILEGYKVAEAIASHGAGASSFSDWWAYKVEVMDAIPHNGALMHDVGIVVSFNSDSSELARRMNTEAAKAVRYGGVDPAEALKFVTLNPAKQLRIDHRIGSLEVGKDADFVIWSGDPLSTYTRCEQTWIEGARYFSLEEDQAMRQRIAAERERLIQKILEQAHGEAETGEEDTEAEAEEPAKWTWAEFSGIDEPVFIFSADVPF